MTPRDVCRASALVLGCASTLAPEGEVLIRLDTDAPIASAGARFGVEPNPLFDRLLLDVFPPEGALPCVGCTREFAVTHETFSEGKASFGALLPPDIVGHRLRVRLFRGDRRADPRAGSMLEVVTYLPAIGREGIRELFMHLGAQHAGRPLGSLEAPVISDAPRSEASRVGTFSGSRVVPCSRSQPASAVCIPGGAFLMGDPRVEDAEGSAGAKERLVILAPYFLDATEVTVGELRASGLAALDSKGRAVDPKEPSLGESCTYTREAGDMEMLPAVCVSAALAEAFCRARGGDLPTEAQYEFAASEGGRLLHPWGNVAPRCDEAVIGGGCQIEQLVSGPARPQRPRSGKRDVVRVPSGAVYDLGANVKEWMRDRYQEDNDACWPSRTLFDPVCTTGAEHAVRGGAYTSASPPPVQKRGKHAREDTVGFRCAYLGR